MHSLNKINALKRRCQISQSRCELFLAQFLREDDELKRDEESIDAQIKGLRNLLKTQRAEVKFIEREELSSILRKQAVLRRKIQNLELQLIQLKEQRKLLSAQCSEQQEKRNYWLRKEHNYQRWLIRKKRWKLQFQLRQDETEQEERNQWKR